MEQSKINSRAPAHLAAKISVTKVEMGREIGEFKGLGIAKNKVKTQREKDHRQKTGKNTIL